METKITAVDTSFGEFHRKASEVHQIPSLQRPYTWETKEVEKLWYDIIENEPPYFIGSIVAVSSDGSVGRDNIIDGQQRLTTISLFLLAIRDYISGKKKKEFIDAENNISELLIKYRKDEEIIRLSFHNKNSNDVYLAIVGGEDLNRFETEAQKRFIKNFELIKKKVAEYSPKCKFSEIDSLIVKITNMQLIYISCLDKSWAYKLFESINATGVSLATTDLIKNYVFEVLQKNKENLKYAEDGWKEMFETFGEDVSYLKTYIRHHWISTIGYTSHSRLFDDFIKKYKNEKNVLEYLKSLFALASVYSSLRDGSVENLDKLPSRRNELNEIKETLQFLSFLGVDQVYSVLLSSYHKDPSNFRKDLIRVTAFQFLYKYIPGSPSVPEKKYFADFCSGKITREKMVSGLLLLCQNLEESFVQKINEKLRYTGGKSGDIQFVLERYLYSLGGAAGPHKFSKPTIEHIIPQDITDEILGKFKIPKKEVIKKIHQLGNQTILEMSQNSSTVEFNKPFSEKVELYREQYFIGNQKIPDYPFDINPEEAIDLRGEEVAIAIYKIFMEALKSGKW